MSDSRVVPMWSAPARLLGDSRLARLAARGDQRAFEAIFRRHHQELYRYCRAILADPDDAQDALQATMVAALRSLPGEKREIDLRPWLFRVAHNQAITIARRRRELPAEESAHGTAPGADVSLEGRERLRHLVSDLRSLPERQRGALVMRELSGLSYSEIASSLGSSEGAARQLVYEAREAMREAEGARATDCSEIRELISRRDGRVLRGRRVRTHIRGCEGCSGYLAAIKQRSSDLQMLAPPLPALAASGLLAAIVGESGKSALVAGSAAGAGGASAAGAGAAGGAAAVVKAGAVVAALAVGAAGGVTAARDIRDGGLNDPPPVSAPADPNAGAETDGGSGGASNSRESASPGDRADDNANANGQPGNGHANAHANGHGNGQANGHDRQPGSQGQGVPAGGSDGVTGPPAHANGNGPPASGRTGTGNAGGNSASSSGVSAAPPRSESGAEHSNAGAGDPPDHANGQGNPHD